MNEKAIGLARLYTDALRDYLSQRAGASVRSAVKLGRQAVASGLETLELARIHEQALVTLNLSTANADVIKRAKFFFNEAITPISETHYAARQSKSDLNRMNDALRKRTAKLAANQVLLQHRLVQRKGVEHAIKESCEHYTKLLKESLVLQDSLRQLTRQLLVAQESKREEISHALQDEIAQTLLGNEREGFGEPAIDV